jgi:hypothetical protein
MEPLLPLADTSAATGAGPSSPEVAASQESKEADTEEGDSTEEGGEEEGRLLGSLLEVAGSLLAGE